MSHKLGFKAKKYLSDKQLHCCYHTGRFIMVHWRSFWGFYTVQAWSVLTFRRNVLPSYSQWMNYFDMERPVMLFNYRYILLQTITQHTKQDITTYMFRLIKPSSGPYY